MGLTSTIKTALSLLYTDVMDVRRYKKGTDADGNAETALDPESVLSGVRCRISFTTMDSPVIGSDTNPTDVMPELFCAPDVPLLSGDFITVTRDGGEVFSGHIGRPVPYPSHLQALFRDKGVSDRG